ncbi:MAG TPA: fumarylacetoacetate hydrolase family protein [Terriglobales bacterium]|nr:fumarylacetoacetate hydrolase family protein [Terriglobales bacterium]
MRKWVRLVQQGQECWGVLHEGATPAERFIQVFSGSPLLAGPCHPHPGIERLPFAGTPLLPPCTPTKIVCVGRNYRAHAEELGHDVPKEPLLFLKPPSSLLPPGGIIQLPDLSRQVEHEGELGVVIRRRCSRVGSDADLGPLIAGFTCVNDVTARDLQNRDPQWTRAKGFDTFCPVGPVLLDGGPSDCSGFALETRVNGVVRQKATTDDFIFSLQRIIVAITAVMTLEPGDLIATGTPAGVGVLRPGDRVEVSISGIGTLENTVEAALRA